MAQNNMMTDKDKLVALLKEFGVGFEDEDGNINCDQGMERVGGYYGFCTSFEFDENGKFVQLGAWE